MKRIVRLFYIATFALVLANLISAGAHSDSFRSETPGEPSFEVNHQQPPSKSFENQFSLRGDDPSDSHEHRNGLHHCGICQLVLRVVPDVVPDFDLAYQSWFSFFTLQVISTPFLDGLIRPPILLA